MRSTIKHIVATTALVVLLAGCGSDTVRDETAADDGAKEASSSLVPFATDYQGTNHTGIVKVYSSAKGAGVVRTESGEDFPVFRASINDPSGTLVIGQRVAFVSILGPKGLEATDVRVFR